MNHEQMAQRCPRARFLKRCKLPGHSLVFDGKSAVRFGAVANIVPDAESEVWGGLFEISASDLRKLDEFECFPDLYQRKEFQVEDDEGQKYSAVAYYRTGQVLGFPGYSYLSELLEGARDCDLPNDYIAGFEKWE